MHKEGVGCSIAKGSSRRNVCAIGSGCSINSRRHEEREGLKRKIGPPSALISAFCPLLRALREKLLKPRLRRSRHPPAEEGVEFFSARGDLIRLLDRFQAGQFRGQKGGQLRDGRFF